MGHHIEQGGIKKKLKSKLLRAKLEKSQEPMLSKWSKTKVIKEI
jgi:hypothetical protein